MGFYKMRRIRAIFADGETTATYYDPAGGGNGSAFEFGADAAISLVIPADAAIAAGVTGVRFQASLNAKAASPTWYGVYDADGSAIEVPVNATTKGNIVAVKPDVITMPTLRLVPVDTNGDAIAPGDGADCAFDIVLKG